MYTNPYMLMTIFTLPVSPGRTDHGSFHAIGENRFQDENEDVDQHDQPGFHNRPDLKPSFWWISLVKLCGFFGHIYTNPF